jgi:hypothetical protein
MAAWVLAAGQLVCGDRPKYKRIIYRAGLNLAACWVWAKLRGCETLGFQANMSNLWGKLNLAGARLRHVRLKICARKMKPWQWGLKKMPSKKEQRCGFKNWKTAIPTLWQVPYYIGLLLNNNNKKTSITWLDFDQDLIRDPIDPSQKKKKIYNSISNKSFIIYSLISFHL